MNRRRLENIRRGTGGRKVEKEIPDNTLAARAWIVIRGKLDDLVAVRAPPRWLTARDTLKALLMHPAKKIRRSLPGVLRSRNGRAPGSSVKLECRFRVIVVVLVGSFGDVRNHRTIRRGKLSGEC